MRWLAVLSLFAAACSSSTNLPTEPSSSPATPSGLAGGGGAPFGAAGHGGSSGSNAGGVASGGGGGAAGAAGSAGSQAATYPPPPYGYAVGDVVADLAFEGLWNPAAVDYATSSLVPISLGDFYNPGGADPKKPRVLVVEGGAMWCGPAIEDAMVARADRATWAGCGVEFVVVVREDVNQMPATAADLATWASDYHFDFPAAIDPMGALGPYFAQGVCPNAMVVDTTTMRLAYVGSEQQDFGADNPVLLAATKAYSCSP